MRIAAWGLVVATGMLALAGCGGGSTHDVTGSITVTGVNSCADFGAFSDVGPGTALTVKDQAGTTIGTATLGTAAVTYSHDEMVTKNWAVDLSLS